MGSLTKDEFVDSIKEHHLPLRDLRMLVKSGDSWRTKHPSLCPRPASKCFIFEIEHIKLLCFSERCIIFQPEEHASATDRFIRELKEQFRCKTNSEVPGLTSQISMKTLYTDFSIGNMRDQDFEFIILESALDNIVSKFKRHLKIKRPALDMLLQQIELQPETTGLKRLLAVKKSLLEFEQRVEHLMKVVQQLMADKEDMVDLYLTRPQRMVEQHEEVEQLFEAHAADLEEIVTETKIFNEMIEDTDQFISAHLDSVRNEIIKLSLFIEIGALVMASGAVVSGIFGMNLLSRIEEFEHGFMLICLAILVMMICIFGGFYQKYYQLRADTSSAHSFTLLKNFFTYVDDLEYYVFNKKTFTNKEFKEAIEKITKLKISDKEAEYLFTMFDSNKDGYIDIEGELNIKTTT